MVKGAWSCRRCGCGSVSMFEHVGLSIQSEEVCLCKSSCCCTGQIGVGANPKWEHPEAARSHSTLAPGPWQVLGFGSGRGRPGFCPEDSNTCRVEGVGQVGTESKRRHTVDRETNDEAAQPAHVHANGPQIRPPLRQSVQYLARIARVPVCRVLLMSGLDVPFATLTTDRLP